LWEVDTGKNTVTFLGHRRGVASVAFSPDGRVLASGSWDKTIKLWDVTTGEDTATFKGHTFMFGAPSVVFSPDGKTVASASGDPAIRLWDVVTGKSIDVKKESFIIVDVAYSLDGKTLASTFGAYGIRLWNVATGQVTATFEQKFGPINCVVYSPDGKTLASASGTVDVRREAAYGPGDTTIRLWDVASGKDTVVLRGRPKGFQAVVFSPDGKTLAAAGLDGTIRLLPAKGTGK
jgi:WD40 repeat protein